MIRFQALFDDVKLPARQNEHDAAFDVYSYEDRTLQPGTWKLFKTGLTMWLPPGYVVLVLPRSGLALKYGITVLNSPGLVDPNYRGELGVNLINHGHEPYHFERNDRIAQLLVVKFIEANCMFAPAESAPDQRGTGGFGSTGR
jgi:dUTP pyrophosphatase